LFVNHVSIPDHLNLCESLPSNVEPPICRADLPTVIFSYDHLEGVNCRHQLNATTETTLLTVLSYFKTVEELGGQVSLALQKVNINFRVRFYCTCVKALEPRTLNIEYFLYNFLVMRK